MKRIRIILMAVLAAVSLTASAQEPFTTLHFLYSPTRLTYSTNEDTEKFNAVAFGATYAQPIESSSFYVEFGGLVEWYFNTQAKGFVNGDNKYFDGKTNIVKNRVPDCWIYVQDKDVKLGRVQIFNNWSPYMVKDPENTVWMGLEYFCDEGDELWSKTDEELVDLAKGEIERIGIARAADVLDAHAERIKKGPRKSRESLDRRCLHIFQDLFFDIPLLESQEVFLP